MLNDKYALLSTPSSQLRALSERDRKQHGAYKELQTDQTKGLFFLSELDLKNSMLLKQGDATGKNILAVLRHVGRLREFKHGGVVLDDIVGGSNPACGTDGFDAAEGWDPVTGFGSPNFRRLLELALSLP